MSDPIQPQPYNGEMHMRVGRLEASVASLHSEVGKLDQGQSEIKAAIALLSDKMGNSSRTNWGVLIGGGSLAIALVSAIGSAFILPLKVADGVHDRDIAELRARQQQNIDNVTRLMEREQIRKEMGR